MRSRSLPPSARCEAAVKSVTLIARSLLSLFGIALVVLGILFWTGHALSLLPLHMLLGGLFVVEYIFNYPGIGLLMINAVFQRDFLIIQAIGILACVVLVCVNIVVDFVATNIDRRLQY